MEVTPLWLPRRETRTASQSRGAQYPKALPDWRALGRVWGLMGLRSNFGVFLGTEVTPTLELLFWLMIFAVGH